MKRLFALVFTVMTGAAWALEHDASNNLADLMYIPGQGQFYGLTRVGMGMLEGNIKSTGSDVDVESDTMSVTQELRYGMTSRWQAYAIYSHLVKGDFELSGDTDASEENTGADRPELGVLYRVLEAQPNSLTLDVYGAYSPDLGDAKYNTSNNPVRGPRDGQGLLAGMRAGSKWTAFEWNVDVRLTYSGEAGSREGGSDDKYTDESHFESWFGVNVQVPLVTNTFWVKGSVHNQRVSSYETEADAGGATSDVVDRVSMIYGVGALWAVVPDQWVVAADLSYETIGSRYDSGVKYEDFNEMRGALSARYQF